MNGQKRTFRRNDTGESQEFTRRMYDIDVDYTGGCQFLDNPSSFDFDDFDSGVMDYYETFDGYRIEQQSDGSFRDKFGALWVPNPK